MHTVLVTRQWTSSKNLLIYVFVFRLKACKLISIKFLYRLQRPNGKSELTLVKK